MIKEVLNNEVGLINESEYAVVDFSATWCGPCKMLHPIIQELSEEINIPFFNVDVDSNDLYSNEMNISNIPAICVMKNGKIIDKSVGFRAKKDLKSFIENLVK